LAGGELDAHRDAVDLAGVRADLRVFGARFDPPAPEVGPHGPHRDDRIEPRAVSLAVELDVVVGERQVPHLGAEGHVGSDGVLDPRAHRPGEPDVAGGSGLTSGEHVVADASRVADGQPVEARP
jgi:hypothetical protein